MKLCCRLLLSVWLLAAPTAIFRSAHSRSESANPTYDLVVTNARIVDGSGNPWFRADVGLRDGRIVRIGRDLNFFAAYTWSKAIDTTSEATFVGAGDTNQTGNNTRTARGLSRFHTPHRFTMYGTYRFPFFKGEKGLLGQTFGGWQVSAVLKLSKGTPFTVITTGVDLNLDGFSETRPVLLDTSVLGRSISNPSTSQQNLPRSAFRSLTIADFNSPTLGRNTFFGDGVQNIDIGLLKTFTMPWEGHRLVLRADLFNAFNHVQFGFPAVDVVGSANFGAITGLATQYAPRSVLVSLRYQY